jgi:hypothetical protein
MNWCLEVNHNGTQYYNLNAKKEQMLIQKLVTTRNFKLLPCLSTVPE